MKPFLSVLIPTYNRVQMTIDAIGSVGDNPEVEIIVVDDCSDISEYNFLRGHFSLRSVLVSENAKLYRNETNLGMTRNFNRCMEFAQGEWFGLIGSDDLYKPGVIDMVVELLHKIPPSLVVYARSNIGRILPPGPETVRSMQLPSGSGNFWHRSIYENLGGFDERLTFSPDGEYWYRIASKYPVVMSPIKYNIYREHGNNLMYDTWRQRDEFLKQIKLIARINMKYRGEDTDDLDLVVGNEIEAEWGAISYILKTCASKPDKQDIFDMYLGKGASMANTKERLNSINKLKEARMKK
jgi:glycosyltransferase involved in cell wall biosynthesis